MPTEPLPANTEKEESETSAVHPEAATDARPATCSPVAGLIIGIVVGGLMWCLLWQFDPENPKRRPFPIPAEVKAKTEGYVVPPMEIREEIELWEKRSALLNDVFFLGLFGLLLAVGLAVVQGLHHKSVKNAAIFGIGGGVLGGAMGLLAGFAGHYAFLMLPERTEFDALTITIIAQGITLSILGLGVGLSFGLFAGNKAGILNFTSFGLIGGVLAALVFAVGSSLLTPDTGTNTTIPDSISNGRLLWCLVIGVAIGGLIPAARSAASSRNKDAATVAKA